MPARLRMLVLFVVCLFAACSRHTQEQAAASAGHPTAVNPCHGQVVTAADLVGILNTPIAAAKPVPGDAQSCIFETSGFPSITVSVRPGVGRKTVDSWLSGGMPLSATALPGVGERAAWQTDLHEIIAQRNDVLCDIQAAGANRDFNGELADLPRRLGALCDKIFDRFADSSKG